MSNRNARALVFLFCAFLFSGPAAALDSASATYRNTRSSVNSAGARKTSTSFLADGAAGEISAGGAASASFAVRDGVMGVEYYPAQIVDLWASSAPAAGGAYLQWTAPGNDGQQSGTSVASYVIKYSSVAAQSPAASDANFDAAQSLTPPAPAVQGTLQTATYSGLLQGVTYYFAIKGVEADGSRGPLSPGATAQTNAPAGCVTTLNVDKAGAPYSTISGALAALSNPLTAYSCVIVRDGSTYAEQVTVQGFTNAGSSITIMADPDSGLTPVVSPPAASTAAFQIANDSVNIQGISIVPTNSMTYGVVASSAYVTISSVNVLDALGRISFAGVTLSSWSTVSESSVTVAAAHGFYLSGTGLALTFSSATNNQSGTQSALNLDGASSSTVTGCFFSNASGNGALLQNGADYNAISDSTFTSGGANRVGLYFDAAHDNTVTRSYASSANGTGAYISNTSNFNNFTESTFTTQGAAYYALLFDNANFNALNGDWILNGAGGALEIYGIYDTVSQSTISGVGYGLYINAASSVSVASSYIQGSTAIYIAASTGTALRGSAVVASAVAGDAVALSGGSVGLTISSCTLTGGAQGRGIGLNPNNQGPFIFSTNTISGGQYGISIAAQAPGTQVYVTSNTILPSLSGSFNTYGVYINGLTSGATIQNNAVYYRTSASAAGNTAYAMYVQSVAGLVIDRNRIDNPGMVTAGSFQALTFNGATNTQVTYNDVHSSGPGLTNAYLLQAQNTSTGLKVRNNIFASSVTVTGSSQTVAVDAGSQAGFLADYNDYFSSNTLAFQWGGAGYATLAAWQAGVAQDASSISGNPLWANTAAGFEDFHPRSTNGRFLNGSFPTDTVDSPTIDKADPADPFGNETAPNGGRANQGSYGNTAEASRSLASYPGCAVTKNVGAGQTFATISLAVTDLKTNNDPLPGSSCIVIRDAATYAEQVTVQGFTNNGSSITIFTDPAVGTNAVVAPPANSTAAFQIAQSSVNVYGIDIAPTNAMTYGVYASSAYITLSSVNVLDALGKISFAGVTLSSWNAVNYTSVTVASAYAFTISPNSNFTTVSNSTATSSSSNSAVWINNSSSVTFTSCYVTDSVGDGLDSSGTCSDLVIQNSTMTNTGGYALYLAGDRMHVIGNVVGPFGTHSGIRIDGGDYTVISSNVITSRFQGLMLTNMSTPTINGNTLNMTLNGSGFNFNNVSYATVNGNTLTGNVISNAMVIVGGYSNVFFGDVISATGGRALLFGGAAGQSNFNTVAQSTMVSDSNEAVLVGPNSKGNTIVDSYIQGMNGLVFQANATGTSSATVLGNDQIYAAAGGTALTVGGTTYGLVASSCVFSAPGGTAVSLSSASGGAFIFSTNTVLSGAQYGFVLSTSAAGVQVFITSNTIFPTLSNTQNTYGVYVNGLTSGATIQNNGVYYRTPGSAAGNTAYAMYVQSGAGLVIDRNRIDNPGMVTGGSFQALMFNGATNTQVTYNDVHSSGTGLTNAYLLQAQNASTGLIVRNNIFASSVTVTGSSQTLSVDAGSQAGFQANYNDYFSSNTLAFQWGAAGYTTLAAWQAGAAQDAGSISGNPLWTNTVAGSEDFHPRSKVGRFLNGSFPTDTVDSPTIDKADPADSFTNETAPNGGRANQGSYGNTAEASRSLASYPGCMVTKNVGAGQTFATISLAVTDLKTNNDPLPGASCIVIRDAATYAEQVTVQGFTNNGSSITIFTDPAVGANAVVAPPANSTAAFQIAQATVNVYGINIMPTNAMTYGVYSSSAYVTLSSVNVLDAGGRIGTAGVSVSSWSVVTYSSVTVAAAAADGFYLAGSTMTTVSYSSAQAAGLYPHAALRLGFGSSSNTFTVLLASNPAGGGVIMGSNANFNTISLSTIVGGASAAADMSLGSSNTITQSYIFNPNGIGLRMGAYLTVSLSTVASSDGTSPAIAFYSFGGLVTQSFVSNPNFAAIEFFNNGGMISRSVVTSNVSGDPGAIWITGSSNTITLSSVSGGNNTNAVRLDGSAAYNTISFSTLTAAVSNRYALWLNGASYNALTQSYLSNLTGTAVRLQPGANANTLSLSTITTANNVAALVVTGASSNTFTQLFVSNPVGNAAYLGAGSNYNTLSVSTFASNASFIAADVLSSSYNAFTQSYFSGSIGVYLEPGSNVNTVSLSTLAGDAGSVGTYGLYLNSSSSNTFAQCVITGSGVAAVLNGNSNANVISLSTLTSGGAGTQRGLFIAGSSSNFIFNSYVQGSTAVYVSASTATVFGGDTLVATNSAGAALAVDGGSAGLVLSSSTLLGTGGAGAGSAGVYLAPGSSGLLVFSTNTVSGAQYGVFIATQTPGALVFITSNTIVPAISGSENTYGVYVNGLTSGATIQNNSIYFRSPANNAGFTAYGLYAQSASKVAFDHNRVDNPGMVTGGSFEALSFNNTAASQVSFTDVHSSGTGLTNHFLFNAANASTGLILKDSVLASSVAVTGSSQTVAVDATSQAGFFANYNDYFSSNTLAFQWGAAGYTTLAAWQSGSAKDANSISGSPLWASVVAGAEDFHPLSPSGHWSTAGQTFVSDTVVSPTIDMGDPAEPFVSEPSPNGGRVNQGSYGNTSEASKSALAPTGVSLAGVWLSSAALQFGGVSAAGYDVDASTDPNFGGVIVSSGSTGVTTLAPQGLLPNTTYFLRAGSLWGQTTVYAQTVVSTATLSKLVSGTTVYQINVTSMVVNWLSLPLAPPEASSNSASGYLLQASTAADFSGTILSSQTPSVELSTLAISNLVGGTTYFFRVGSLNWNGAANYAATVSTLMPIQLGVYMTTHTIGLGLTNLNTTVVISTSIILTNTGNVAETYYLRATTTTVGSPWTIAATPGVDKYVMWTVVNSTSAANGDFLTADQLADAETACSASAFTMGNQNCVQVPAGGTRTIWVQVAMPVVTSTNVAQSLQITARAVKDP
jgi:parallel beta-helix repeat protein